MSVSTEFEQAMNKFKKDFGAPVKYVVLGFLVLALAIGAMSSFYTVKPDEEAVVIRLGRYLTTNPPGLHFKLPFGIDRKIIVKTKLLHQAEFGFRSRGVQGTRTSYSKANFDKESLMLTGDLNVADVEWVVLFKISDPFKFLFQASDPMQNIQDVSESIMRRVVGDKLVTDVLTVGRVEIGATAKLLMQEVLDRYDIGIQIESVKLQDVNPPEAVKAAFNEVNAAKQEQEKAINNAKEAYNKVIPEARGKAEQKVTDAEGYAEALINRSEGDANKFTAILREYKKAPAITRKRLYLETMQILFKRFEKLTIVDSDIKGLLPVFNQLKQQ